MSDLLELPDPHSIPLPDDIPLPTDDIPLPSDETTSGLRDCNNLSTNTSDSRSQTRGKKASSNNAQLTDNKLDEESQMVAQMMGFSSFNSTKGKMVPGNQTIGAVHVVKRRRYRQYMNRKGGFNRPLDKVA